MQKHEDFARLRLLKCSIPAKASAPGGICRLCLGREEGQQGNQGTPEQFASTNKKIAEIYQKFLYGLHLTKIIQ